jgi:hypothetical protein
MDTTSTEPAADPKIRPTHFTAQNADVDNWFMYTPKNTKPFWVNAKCLVWEFQSPDEGVPKNPPENTACILPCAGLPDNSDAGSQFVGCWTDKNVKGLDSPVDKTDASTQGPYWRGFSFGPSGAMTLKPDGQDEVTLPLREYMMLVAAGQAVDGDLGMFQRLLSLCSQGDFFYDKYNRPRVVEILEDNDPQAAKSPILAKDGVLRITREHYADLRFGQIAMLSPFQFSYFAKDGGMMLEEDGNVTQLDKDWDWSDADVAKEMAPQPVWSLRPSPSAQSDDAMGDEVTSSYTNQIASLAGRCLHPLHVKTIEWIKSDVVDKGIEHYCPGLMNLTEHRSRTVEKTGAVTMSVAKGVTLDLALRWDTVLDEHKASTKAEHRDNWDVSQVVDALFDGEDQEPLTDIYPVSMATKHTAKDGSTKSVDQYLTRFDKARQLLMMSMPSKAGDYFPRMSAYMEAIAGGKDMPDEIVKSNPFCDAANAGTSSRDVQLLRLKAALDTANDKISTLEKEGTEKDASITELTEDKEKLATRDWCHPSPGDIVVLTGGVRFIVNPGIEAVHLAGHGEGGNPLTIKLNEAREFSITAEDRTKTAKDRADDALFQELATIPCNARIGYNGK